MMTREGVCVSKLYMTGQKRLSGDVQLQGAKNSALPLLAATVLAQGESVLYNCPQLSDTEASLRILRWLGCGAERCDGVVIVKNDGIARHDIPDSFMRQTRGSVLFLGAVLAKQGRVRLSLPGGCEIGQRPIANTVASIGSITPAREPRRAYAASSGRRHKGAARLARLPRTARFEGRGHCPAVSQCRCDGGGFARGLHCRGRHYADKRGA